MSERASAKFAALSAKFFFFLPSSWRVCQVWYKLYRVSAKFFAFLPSLLAPSWQKIANSEPLSTKSTNSIVSVCNNFELAIFCQLGRKAKNLAEAKRESGNGGSPLYREVLRNSSRLLDQLGPDSYDSLNLIVYSPWSTIPTLRKPSLSGSAMVFIKCVGSAGLRNSYYYRLRKILFSPH